MDARQPPSSAGTQLQSEIGIMPCAANALLNEEGIPVVCETDIHGAITALLVEAADMGENTQLLRRLDYPSSGYPQWRTAAALRPVAHLCCQRESEDYLPAGI